MTAKDLLHQALQAGLRFEADGEHLRVRGDEAVIGAWAERVAIAAAVAERLKGRNHRPEKSGNISGLTDKGETRDLAAAKAGLGSAPPPPEHWPPPDAPFDL